MPRRHTPVNIRNFSVKCGRCDQYQVLARYEPGEEHNIYVYECEWPPCDVDIEGSRTLIEVPADLDEFANRDPSWGGGKKHAGADMQDGEASDEEAEPLVKIGS